MKRTFSCPFWVSVPGVIGLVVCLLGPTRAFADVEIDLDDLSKPTPTPAAKSAPTPKTIILPPTATPLPMKQSAVIVQSTPTPIIVTKQDAEAEPEPTAIVVSGTFKMKDIYNAGIKSYKEMDYDQAIRYLTEAVKKNDPTTPKFYYAEAYATLGIIYEFHIIHFDRAYEYYRLALKYEKNNRTAKKHIKEVVSKTQE